MGTFLTCCLGVLSKVVPNLMKYALFGKGREGKEGKGGKGRKGRDGKVDSHYIRLGIWLLCLLCKFQSFLYTFLFTEVPPENSF